MAQVGGDKSRKAQIEKNVKTIRYAIRQFIRSKAEVEVEESEAIDWMNPTGNSGTGQPGIDKFSRFGKYTKGFKSIGVIDREETQPGQIDIPAPPKRKKKKSDPTEKKKEEEEARWARFSKKFKEGEKNLGFSQRSHLSESRHRLTAILDEVCEGTLYVMQVGGDLSAYKQLKIVDTNIGTVSRLGGVHISDIESEKIVMDVKFAEDLSDGSTILSWVPGAEEEEKS